MISGYHICKMLVVFNKLAKTVVKSALHCQQVALNKKAVFVALTLHQRNQKKLGYAQVSP